MTHQTVHLPDGRKFTVTPVFGGLGFRAQDHNDQLHPFPVGWMTVLHTEEDKVEFAGHKVGNRRSGDYGLSAREIVTMHHSSDEDAQPPKTRRRTRPFVRPTLQNDSLFISSLSMPSSSEFKPATSPTRQIAMMLWVTLYWYFHQPEPEYGLDTAASKDTPAPAKPAGEWKIWIKQDGVLRGRNLIPKLERMGLIASEDSSVGTSVDDRDGWANMFVSKRMFWQIPGRLFLFTLQPVRELSLPGSPINSRPGSPNRDDSSYRVHPHSSSGNHLIADVPGAPVPTTVISPPQYPVGPFFSSSYLPTYFPPPPLQYTYTNNVRHPLRPKPPRMGEVFYTRFIDSVGQYLSFRVASTSTNPVPYLGPVGPNPPEQQQSLSHVSDIELLQSWFAKDRIQAFWGKYTSNYLENALCSKHSFPIIGLWDGVPFGYFELYWVKEDALGIQAGSEIADWDRGVHVMIGEEWARGRVPAWLTSLIHYCFIADFRTMNICLEPRIDNQRMLKHLDAGGFAREKQVSFPHKQAWYVRLRRENWSGPTL